MTYLLQVTVDSADGHLVTPEAMTVTLTPVKGTVTAILRRSQESVWIRVSAIQGQHSSGSWVILQFINASSQNL